MKQRKSGASEGQEKHKRVGIGSDRRHQATVIQRMVSFTHMNSAFFGKNS
jgi:hypothetical protein